MEPLIVAEQLLTGVQVRKSLQNVPLLAIIIFR